MQGMEEVSSMKEHQAPHGRFVSSRELTSHMHPTFE